MVVMARPRRRPNAAAEQRREIALALVKLVRQALDAGEEPPWRKPWVGGYGRHRTGRKGRKRPYQRLNAWSTWVVAAGAGYRSEHWYTREQAEKQGWSLKPGHRGASIIVPLFQRDRDDGPSGGWLPSAGDWGGAVVYNRDAFDGPEPEDPPPPWESARGIDRTIALLGAVGLDLRLASGAWFHHGEDHIGLPHPNQFDGPEAWAATALHELLHWTGYRRRLARITHPWTREEYALEELVAELGAAMLCGRLGVAGTRPDDAQHQEYLTIWARRIQQAPEALEQALEQADQACRFLEDLAPEVFAEGQSKGAHVSVQDAPRRLDLGHLWIRDPIRILRVPEPLPEPPGLLLGVEAAAKLSSWCKAVERWVAKPKGRAPMLLLAGFPGDGAESLLVAIHGHMIRAPHPPLAWCSGEGLRPLELPAPTTAWREAPLLPRRGQDWRLPAFAFLGPGDKAPSAEDLLTSLDRGHSLSAPAVVVVRRIPAVERRTQAVTVLDLAAEPLALGYAAWRLRKSDARTWLAIQHRRPGETRLAESWTRRLRTSRPWLDGQEHGIRNPLQRAALRDTAPVAPTVIQTAQAVLDSIARLTNELVPLSFLLEGALAHHPLHQPHELIPLDVLMAPLFRSALPAEPGLLDRARFVVQLLLACPELSRGSKGLALLLSGSMDQDLDALAAELETRWKDSQRRPSRTPRRPRERRGELVYQRRSWSCTVPLRYGGVDLWEP
jgi:antirestriction protein ArdC